MDSDYRIVRTPAALLARTGHRHLLVEAVELHGGVILRGAYVPPPYAAAGTPIQLADDDVLELELAAVAAALGDRLRAKGVSSAWRALGSAGPVAHTRPRVSRARRHL